MRTLLILRHAKSSWDDPGLRDHDRPLNKRGTRTAPKMGRFLAGSVFTPDMVLASTALRARMTAELAIEGGGIEAPISVVEDLYLSNPATMLAIAARRGGDAKRLMLVAHNPGCAELVSKLSGQEQGFPTGALAVFDFDVDSWSEVGLDTPVEMRGLWRPKQLPD